ncbi:Crp/Fnr family transcriptional regulator [Hasllibacter sp. MH4015]|uniref:Crp/Fnr family transcriptional regulator n=1 Tax=Hasllibacter sp. MH4015 TaxID=2854029 RepID=UPI001CD6A771|nr:cyclic nucleotide-binding domain-containing protein [Hasllibacter sp. MH4015]
MEFSIWAAFGIAAAAIYVVSYGMLQLGFIRGRSFTYTLMNLVAAAFALVSLGDAFNISTLLTSSFWVLLSLIGLYRLIRARSQTNFTKDELAFLSAHFPGLPPQLARQFLSLGRWQTVSEGTILARQGAPVQELVFIASGHASVRAHGAEVAMLEAGALIGEMSVIHGSDATADVEITQSARIFALPREGLIRELEMDHDFALAVSRALQLESQRKLDKANRERAGVAPL